MNEGIAATIVASVDALSSASLAFHQVKESRRLPMLRAEDNRVLTESGPGLPMRELLRRAAGLALGEPKHRNRGAFRRLCRQQDQRPRRGYD